VGGPMIRRLDVKIVLALIVTVLLPLGCSVYLVAKALETSLGLGLNIELESQLERGLAAQKKRIQEQKQRMRRSFDHLSDSRRLADAVATGETKTIRAALYKFTEDDPSLREVRILGEGATPVEALAAPIETQLRTLPLRKEVALGPYTTIEALYGIDESILAAYNRAGEQFATYQALVKADPEYLEDRFVWVYLVILGVTVMLSILIGVVWSRRLARRITRLSRATALVARNDLTVRVDPGPEDEVGALVESFNSMVSELGASRTRIEYLQKISAWQEMARRLAHEIKNPLTPIQLATQQLKEKYDGGDEKFQHLLDQSTEIITEEVATLRRLTSDFSSFAKLPEITPEKEDLGDFLAECEASLSPVTEQEGVAITFEAPTGSVPVMIDRIMMKRVIDNLVRNAAQAIAQHEIGSGRIAVSAREIQVGGQPHLEIRVEDNGPGIAPEHRLAIFDPYFTTKSEGTGLGLAISKKIVLEHGGHIALDEKHKQGTAFVIGLKLSDKGV
jgi:two-component system nitrogen regulation sensor histidine kinase NtrY